MVSDPTVLQAIDLRSQAMGGVATRVLKVRAATRGLTARSLMLLRMQMELLAVFGTVILVDPNVTGLTTLAQQQQQASASMTWLRAVGQRLLLIVLVR